ncbi:acyltransferase [Inhella sp.]|uniref:acyltransferase n=1 Tax=Inhella sp. TaxID=1921806 RepID=UPI0035B02BDC
MHLLLIRWPRALLCALLLALSTVLLSVSLLPPALLKRLLPWPAVQRPCDRLLMQLAGAWVALNKQWMDACNPGLRWRLEGLEGLSPQGWYLLTCNHLSSVDILVLQHALHGRIPFLKFFLKRELIWMPVIGMAWWALDFPFMRRGKTREDQRRDLEAARASCEKFRRVPTSVMNFVEGTRATPEKREAERSPYRHLLKPKVGGLSVALATMGEQFEALLDVTLVYPAGTPSFWDLLCGNVPAVVLRVQRHAIPPALLGMEAAGERARLVRQARWLEQIWAEKDAWIDAQLNAGPRADQTS